MKGNLVLIFEGPILHLCYSNCFLNLCEVHVIISGMVKSVNNSRKKVKERKETVPVRSLAVWIAVLGFVARAREFSWRLAHFAQFVAQARELTRRLAHFAQNSLSHLVDYLAAFHLSLGGDWKGCVGVPVERIGEGRSAAR